MKFKIDENLPLEAAALLREAGHDALTVHDQNLRGALDPKLRAVCIAEGRIPIKARVRIREARP
jgi:predicted nuclease of predicted toxin-antitoxin system